MFFFCFFFIFGITGGHTECVQLLTEAGGTLPDTPCQLACRLNTMVMDNNIERLELHVLHARVNVNCSDYDRRSPLHIAAAEGRIECVNILLRGGADSKLKDRWGSTPLKEAKKNGHLEVVELMQLGNGGEGEGEGLMKVMSLNDEK